MRELPDLPVTAVLPQLGRTLAKGRNAVLVAPPGAGKTTLAPLFLLDALWLGGGTIILLEPRRLAARAAARRMASLLGEEVGDSVGYAMRMDSRTSAGTRILVVTEGVLARMILDDPELTGIAAVIFDEYHERSLDGDFGLALALDVQGALRPDLRLLVMSATLDGARVAALLKDAAVIESEGRSFPVEIRHEERPPDVLIEDAVARTIRGALLSETGSILAFLPGQREIMRVAERLEGRLPGNVDLTPLYGALDGKAQDAAIRPPPEGRRKVVLATSIAETSITIDGVRVVVDSGLSRLPKYEPATGLTRLETVRVSRASAEQRAGRAGRTQAGVAIRLWRAEQTASLAPFTPPEILEADLSGLVLDCAGFGVADPASLSFLDAPPAAALKEAKNLLRELGAIDAEGRLTASGEAMRRLALPVRLAHMVAEAARFGQALRAAELAVLLTERGLGGNSPDLEQRLSQFANDKSPRASNARALAARLARSAGNDLLSASLRSAPLPLKWGEDERRRSRHPLPRAGGEVPSEARRRGGDEVSSTSAGFLLLRAWPDRVAKQRGGYGRYVLANGRGAMLDAIEPLARETFIVVADLQGKAQNARITAAACVSEDDIRLALAHRIGRKTISAFDAEKRAVRVTETVRLGAITLSENTLPSPSGADADRAIVEAVCEHGLSLLPWSKEAENLRDRLHWLHRGLGSPWPDMSDATLLAALDDWLLPFLSGEAALSRIDPGAVKEGLMSLVPYELQRKTGEFAPTHFHAPSGSHVPIRYDGEWPVLAIRVQELFGLDRHPAIAGGSVPLTLELLSPAHRPIQRTRDLPGFWRGSWAEVRSQMRGRYPKHVWPEDPVSAEATSRAKPRVK